MIVSVHIPKTGGVSFRKSVLEPVFGNRLLSDYGDAPLSHDTANRNARAQSFEPSPELPERYDCVHGHFLALKYVSERVPCEFAVWFRDPAQRVVSRYLYGKRKGGRTITPGMTIREFCEIERFQNTYAKFLWGFDFEGTDQNPVIYLYTCERLGPETRGARGRAVQRGEGAAAPAGYASVGEGG